MDGADAVWAAVMVVGALIFVLGIDLIKEVSAGWPWVRVVLMGWIVCLGYPASS